VGGGGDRSSYNWRHEFGGLQTSDTAFGQYGKTVHCLSQADSKTEGRIDESIHDFDYTMNAVV
jgi:hypothetical protein